MGDNIRKSCMGMEVDPYFSNKKWPSALFFFFFLISINMSSEKMFISLFRVTRPFKSPPIKTFWGKCRKPLNNCSIIKPTCYPCIWNPYEVKSYIRRNRLLELDHQLLTKMRCGQDFPLACIYVGIITMSYMGIASMMFYSGYCLSWIQITTISQNVVVATICTW